MKPHNLITLIAAAVLTLISPAHAADPSDTRQAVVLTPREYSFLLSEMRGHLDAIGIAQQALSTGDMETARQAMLERGTARLKSPLPGRPPSFGHKTPDAWRAMASGMHQSYDSVAEGIASKETAPQLMGRIAKLMHHCAGCHASYRLIAAP